ncbi:molybdopterin molybdenumtransferase MoeA [Rhodosalinus sediminis]|uniref:Molybdopterin molybdenumtransferase n=1 Tax=Rhodosalinus sediminis TaxID=1940533 RepID=A0A3D9BP01_9RHOB|nr:gephyrin-like molybdotransferase Glp [Rhodosalinus sediminis]REC55162.1 molybdopterin molybdenumtransferase MoeA [Rhodosalinus sediminis]
MTAIDRLIGPGCGCDAGEGAGAAISLDAALERIAAHAAPVAGTEALSPAAAAGRILARPVAARAAAPPFDNAAMDGYAVATRALSGEGPWWLAVTDRVTAGQGAPAPLPGAMAARIFTGAPIPPGADAVVMQEHVHREGDAIRIDARPAPGLNLRRAGEDMAAGQLVLDAGRRLGPREIAAAAAAGADRLHVRRPLRVALMVTGDEVQPAGVARAAAAAIPDVNTPMLAAALAGPAVELVAVAHGGDDRAALTRRIADLAARADLVVTTGGLSVGEADHVAPALAALGAEVCFAGVAIKPGKPVAFGRLGAATWLGLPGNPLAAFVSWHLFGRALLRRLAGQTHPVPARRHVVTATAIHRTPGRCEIRPAAIAGCDAEGREIVRFEASTQSGRVAGLPGADGLMFLPAEADHLPAGALVEFEPFAET